MKKTLFLLILLSFRTLWAVEVIQPNDCKFFNAIAAGTSLNSTDSSAFGKPFDLAKMSSLSVHVRWASLTGSVDGTVKVQVASTNFPASGDWVDKPGATFTMSGATGNNIINITNIGERWGRVVYAHNSISGGTVTGFCHAKSN